MKLRQTILLSFLIAANVFAAAQSMVEYKNGVGASIGNMGALSYKTFLEENMALVVDAGAKFTICFGSIPGDTIHNAFYVGEVSLQPNMMYQQTFHNSSWMWFAGGGFSVGRASLQHVGIIIETIFRSVVDNNYVNTNKNGLKLGVNAIAGIEKRYRHFGFQMDIRPGYGHCFVHETNPKTLETVSKYNLNYLDFGINFSFRYLF